MVLSPRGLAGDGKNEKGEHGRHRGSGTQGHWLYRAGGAALAFSRLWVTLLLTTSDVEDRTVGVPSAAPPSAPQKVALGFGQPVR